MTSHLSKDIVGYCDALSVASGGWLGLKVSTYGSRNFELDFVRILGASWDRKSGSKPKLQELAHDQAGNYEGRFQPVPIGSSAHVPIPSTLIHTSRLCFGLIIMPTKKQPKQEVVFLLSGNQTGLSLVLDDQYLLAVQDGARQTILQTHQPLQRGEWVAVCCEYEFNSGKLTLASKLLGKATETHTDTAIHPMDLQLTDIHFAARPEGHSGKLTDHFNGRLESPILASSGMDEVMDALLRDPTDTDMGEADILARWDFSQQFSTDKILDTGPNKCHGRLINRPARAVTGAFWDGSDFVWTSKPQHYAAIHFHDDDLEDCLWQNDVDVTIPTDWPSGLYGARIRTPTGQDLVPFVVRAPKHTRSRVAVLLPTFTYLSYGNAKNDMRGPDFNISRYEDELFLGDHPEMAKSQYDLHNDGSPVMYTSAKRPLLSMRFGIRPWGLPVDAALLSWLEHENIDYDMLTDGDLHRDGAESVRPYDCVLTGNHPEYYSKEMLDALNDYTSGGGRLMYLGGNGFYWRVSVSDDGSTLEVRRAEDGTRAWICEPGEAYHAMDGKYGGLWRRLGRPPNRLVGVGFAAQGSFDTSGYYNIRSGVREGPNAFLLEGVEGDRFGDFGWLGNGAAGQEIDRADIRLGTDQHTEIIASSSGHEAGMLRTIEELLSTPLPFDDKNCRADVTLRRIDGGGAVFSVGSMTWIAALDHNGFDNDVARVTRNALTHFLQM